MPAYTTLSEDAEALNGWPAPIHADGRSAERRPVARSPGLAKWSRPSASNRLYRIPSRAQYRTLEVPLGAGAVAGCSWAPDAQQLHSVAVPRLQVSTSVHSPTGPRPRPQPRRRPARRTPAPLRAPAFARALAREQIARGEGLDAVEAGDGGGDRRQIGRVAQARGPLGVKSAPRRRSRALAAVFVGVLQRCREQRRTQLCATDEYGDASRSELASATH